MPADINVLNREETKSVRMKRLFLQKHTQTMKGLEQVRSTRRFGPEPRLRSSHQCDDVLHRCFDLTELIGRFIADRYDISCQP